MGVFVQTHILSPEPKAVLRDVREGMRDQFTNPLLECGEFPESLSIGERKSLRADIASMVDVAKRKGTIAEASIYFRDLNNGPWFGVNQEKKFAPASMLKVPLAMSFYYRAETEPEVLTTEYEYEKGTDNYEANQPYAPATSLENGRKYSVEDLITLMLTESSNEAALVLAQIAGQSQIQSVYKDFGVTVPISGSEYLTDAHSFGSFFRMLYNSTYLDRSKSEHLLSMLSNSTFHDGIVAGVPTGVTVAHKFGTREIEGQVSSKQLHDCGIVYAKETPYILCVMTQGNDYKNMVSFIRDVSKEVYGVVTEKQ